MSSSAVLGQSTSERNITPPKPHTPRSPSTFVVITPPPCSSFTIPPPPERYSMDYNPNPRALRSRTPDPIADASSSYFPTGVPLSRYPTTPANDSLYDPPVGRTMTKQEREAREVARANKLAKMGFSSSGDNWPGVGSLPSRSHKPRFGGIKTFVQTLKGKS